MDGIFLTQDMIKNRLNHLCGRWWFDKDSATAVVGIYIVFMLYCVNDHYTENILHFVSKGKEKCQNIK